MLCRCATKPDVSNDGLPVHTLLSEKYRENSDKYSDTKKGKKLELRELSSGFYQTIPGFLLK